MRLAWTRENVAFANPCFNSNGRDMTQCEPTLAFQTYTTQQDNTAQSRVNDAIQFDNTFTWFKPGLKGDHDIKLGGKLRVRRRQQHQPGQHERDVRVRAQRRSVRCRQPVHLSRSAHDSRRRRVALLREGALRHRLRAGQVADEQPADAQPRLPLRPWKSSRFPKPTTRSPARATTRSTRTTSSRGSASRTTWAAAAVELIRGGYGRFFEKTHFELIGGLFTGTPFTNSFTRTFPLTGADPEPAPGADADRSDAGQRADAEPGAARHAVRSRHAAAQHRRQLGQPRSSRCRRPISSRSAISISSGRGSRSAPTTSTRASSDMLMSLQLNPTLRATTAVTSPNIRQSSAILDQATAELREKYGPASRRSPAV